MTPARPDTPFSPRQAGAEWHRLARTLLCAVFMLCTLPFSLAAEQQDGFLDNDIRLRDDTVLSASLFLPEGDGPFPALYQATALPTHQQPGSNDPLVSLYTQAGYALVRVNVRGTGTSGGDFTLHSRQEQQDHYEVIQWIAGQPWSNGRVAGFGAGYSGSAQWHMAIQAPPALACIAPVNAVLNPYWDWFFPGGLASIETLEAWYERGLRIPHAYPANGEPRLLSLDLRYEFLAHPLYDAFWEERDSSRHLGQIRVPAFIIQQWAPEQPGLDSSLRALGSLRNLHRTLLLDESTAYIDDPDFHRRELLRFYDWCLGGQDNDFIAGPEIRYQVPGRTLERRERRWPPGDIEFQPLTLQLDSATVNRETPAGSQSTRLSASEGEAVLQFLSPPLQHALEMTGAGRVSLTLSSDQVDAGIAVRLYEVPTLDSFDIAQLPSFLSPDAGESAAQARREEAPPLLVTQGRLRLSLRAADSGESPGQALFLSATEPRWLQTGRSLQIDIPLRSTAHRFRRGSRLLLEIEHVQDDPALQRWPARLTLQSQPQRPAQLWLPLQQNSASLIDEALSEPAVPASGTTLPLSQPPALPGFSAPPASGSIDYEAALFDSDSLFILLPPPDNDNRR